MKKPKPIIENEEPIHSYFGLSYASYLVIPRSVLQTMPTNWQKKFCELLNQIPEVISEHWEPEGFYHVQLRDAKGRYISDPYCDYERGRRRLKTKKAGNK